jgi:hypothetical protein
MKNFTKLSSTLFLFLTTIVLLSGCSSDDDTAPQLTGASKQFVLFSKSNPAISGTVTFQERNDDATLITVQLAGTSSGAVHPAHIHASTAAEGGAILLDLISVDGASGKSETVVTTLNDGSTITYNQLINLDGYVNVHLSTTELATLVAQGDVGNNELTSTSKTYNLTAVSNPAISGTAKFTKRVSGKTLVSLALTGTTAGVSSIAHIHLNTVAQTGGVIVDLTSVTGASGKSETSIKELNTGVAITYDEFLNFNGYINVHESASALSTLIAQGNIGANEDVIYNVTNAGASDYVFNGGSFANSSDPTLALKRGRIYIFNLNSPGHPFLIKTVQTTGIANSYNVGVTNNGASIGTLIFTVPLDAPNTLFYICEFHSAMTGVINITN